MFSCGALEIDMNDADFVLPTNWQLPKSLQWIRQGKNKIDEETKTYVEMIFVKLRNINIKSLVLDTHRTKNNLPKGQRYSKQTD